VLVIFRNSGETEIMPNPDENTVFYADDTAVLLGSPEKISKAALIFHKKNDK
jgi:Trk K+ transport system NAD-binding subunit